MFGDVALSKNQVRNIHGTDQRPGSGGWPTIRYFNKKTGYGGASYNKKTAQAMCDELGPKETFMQEYIEEAGDTSLCKISKTDVGCTAEQKEFIEKWGSGKAEDNFDQVVKDWTMARGLAEEEVSFLIEYGIAKFDSKTKDKQDAEKQLTRLMGLLGGAGSDTKPEALASAKKRLGLLKQLVPSKATKEEL